VILFSSLPYVSLKSPVVTDQIHTKISSKIQIERTMQPVIVYVVAIFIQFSGHWFVHLCSAAAKRLVIGMNIHG
jgi:putative effector of murein hydrolase